MAKFLKELLLELVHHSSGSCCQSCPYSKKEERQPETPAASQATVGFLVAVCSIEALALIVVLMLK